MNTRHRQHGLTLWELLMALLVAGILIGLGVPNVMEFQRNGQMIGLANDLLTATLSARAEAVKRQRPVVLCLSADPAPALPALPVCSPNAVADGSLGFIVWVDDDNDGGYDAGEALLTQRAVAPDLIGVSANCGHVGYAPNGWARQIGALCAPAVRTILFCDDRGRRATSGNVSSARVVRIDATGRGVVQQEVADVTAAVAAIDAVTDAPTCP
jgi:type IV fimbrial biogenesis protein FimT